MGLKTSSLYYLRSNINLKRKEWSLRLSNRPNLQSRDEGTSCKAYKVQQTNNIRL